MAIRTEDPKIAEAIIVSAAVDMIQLERNGLAIPLVPAAHLTSRLLHPSLDEPDSEIGRVDRLSNEEDRAQWPSRDSRLGAASPPRLAYEMESIYARPLDTLVEP